MIVFSVICLYIRFVVHRTCGETPQSPIPQGTPWADNVLSQRVSPVFTLLHVAVYGVLYFPSDTHAKLPKPLSQGRGVLGYIPDIFGNPSFLSTRGFGNFAVR